MRKKRKKYPTVKKIDPQDLQLLLERARNNALTEEDCANIQAMAETIGFIIDMLNQKDTKVKQLLKQILGIKSEKTGKVIAPQNLSNNLSKDNQPQDGVHGVANSDPVKTNESDISDNKPNGHGRNGVDCYTGAKCIYVAHPTLKRGDPCSECPKGKVYPERNPGVFIHIEGNPPITATVYELEKLRCNLCGQIFQAPLPDKIKNVSKDTKYYDETAKSMMVILRYGYGFALTRLANLQARLGIPLPDSTGWDKSEDVADKAHPVFEELKQQGAQAQIVYNDDTGMKVIDMMKQIEKEVNDAPGKKIRTGIFTTGIVAVAGDRKIALFFTGRQHAGENLSNLLEHRDSNLQPPIQMCDAKNGNTKNNETIPCFCNTHARRRFVDISDKYPDQCTYVIVNVYKEIYKNDAIAREKNLSFDERLQFHKEKSKPIMDDYYIWLTDQFDQKLVEPNSDIGVAISYVINHWEKLTRFLHVAGAPLDNNICERALKMAIRHRKNSLFYKTQHGAYIGDMFMSLIYTCQFANVNPFDYLTELQRYTSDVFKNPSQWMPWNYKDRLGQVVTSP